MYAQQLIGTSVWSAMQIFIEYTAGNGTPLNNAYVDILLFFFLNRTDQQRYTNWTFPTEKNAQTEIKPQNH